MALSAGGYMEGLGVHCTGVFRLLAGVTLLAELGLFVGCQGCLKFAGGIVGRYGW